MLRLEFVENKYTKVVWQGGCRQHTQAPENNSISECSKIVNFLKINICFARTISVNSRYPSVIQPHTKQQKYLSFLVNYIHVHTYFSYFHPPLPSHPFPLPLKSFFPVGLYVTFMVWFCVCLLSVFDKKIFLRC